MRQRYPENNIPCCGNELIAVDYMIGELGISKLESVIGSNFQVKSQRHFEMTQELTHLLQEGDPVMFPDKITATLHRPLELNDETHSCG